MPSVWLIYFLLFPVLPRILSVLIIGFWLTMSGLLMQSVWFPADSHLTLVNPGAVLQLITARGENSALDIYEDRRIVGNLTVQAVSIPLHLRSKMKLRLNGRINLDRAPLAGTSLLLDSWLELDHAGNIQALSLHLKTINPAFSLTLSQAGPEQPPAVLLQQNERVLLDSTIPAEGTLDSNPMVALLLGTLGISLPDLGSLRQQAETRAAAMVLEARQGEFDLNGNPRQGYILKIGQAGQPGFRLCVENSGEIVLLETPTTYRLVTDTLRPPSAYP